jgi:hypothetical protein
MGRDTGIVTESFGGMVIASGKSVGWAGFVPFKAYILERQWIEDPLANFRCCGVAGHSLDHEPEQRKSAV